MKLWVRISLLIATIAALFGILLSTFFKIESERILFTEHKYWSSGLTQALSSAILQDTIKNKQRKVKEILTRVQKNNPTISYLIVTGFNGNILASTMDNVPHKLLNKHSDHEGSTKLIINGVTITDITQPLVKNLDSHLHIGINSQFIDKIIKDTFIKIIVTTIIITLISIFIGIIFSRKISSPIEQLSESLKAFGKGDKHNFIQIENAAIEVRNLYKSFDEMKIQREEHENELKFYRQELEQLVKERTAELEQEIILHKQTTNGLKLAKDEAEKANRAKSIFLSQMSHEFRTPLNAILGFSQLIEIDKSTSPDCLESIEIIKNAGNHLLQLINEILNLAKIEAGKIEVNIETVSWDELVQECIDTIQPLADQRNISIRFNNPETISQTEESIIQCNDAEKLVSADKVKLKQITFNLLSNAVKYNSDSGLINIVIENTNNNSLRLSVQDTGKGISKNSQQHIFEPFNRLDSADSSVEGTGIGLLITKRLTEIMNGKIGFNSEEDIGSTFWVELPVSHELPEKSETEKPDRILNTRANNEELIKLLLIEDNPVNVKLVNNILSKFNNVSLTSCLVPQEGITSAQSISPDLILLDINMPDMNGYEVKKQLDEFPSLKNIPIIAFTANAMQKDIDAAFNAGFTDYLTKPINITEFIKILNKYLKNKIE